MLSVRYPVSSVQLARTVHEAVLTVRKGCAVPVTDSSSKIRLCPVRERSGTKVRTSGCRAGTASAVPSSAGFFGGLLLRDDLTKPGQVIEDQLNAVAVQVAGGIRDVAWLRAACRDAAMAGSFRLGQGVRGGQARRSVPAARPWPAAGTLPGCRGSARRAR